MASIAKLLETLPGETGVLPGHMQPTTLARARAARRVTTPFACPTANGGL